MNYTVYNKKYPAVLLGTFLRIMDNSTVAYVSPGGYVGYLPDSEAYLVPFTFTTA